MSSIPEGDDFHEELDDIRQEAGRFLGRRMLLWLVRWIIGFGAIAAIVHYQPRLQWLWWVGVGVALVTPLLSWLTRMSIDRQLTQADEKFRELRDTLEDIDESPGDN